MATYGVCKNCGQSLDYYSRSNRETCSDTCRKAWSRRKDKLKRDGTHLLNAIQTMQQYLNQPDLAEMTRAYLFTAEQKLDELQKVSQPGMSQNAGKV